MKRLDAFLSSAGVGSRKYLREIISKGKVSVNGNIIIRPEFKVNESDIISYDGKLIADDEFIYLMLNKPKGYVCTNDTSERNIFELMPTQYKNKKLFCVGRLDKDTSGLIIITNDGSFCHRIISPNHNIKKVYKAVLKNDIDDMVVKKFSEGLTLKDGLFTRPALIEYTDKKNVVLVSLYEGKYHQVRRMFAACDNLVLDLCRISVGLLSLDGLQEGHVRQIKKNDIENF